MIILVGIESVKWIYIRKTTIFKGWVVEKCNVKEGLLLLLFNINNNITLELLNNSRLTLGAANNNKR